MVLIVEKDGKESRIDVDPTVFWQEVELGIRSFASSCFRGSLGFEDVFDRSSVAAEGSTVDLDEVDPTACLDEAFRAQRGRISERRCFQLEVQLLLQVPGSQQKEQ